MKKSVFIFCAITLFIVFSSCDEEKFGNFYATLYGTVCDGETGELIPFATVVLSPGGKTKMTGMDGRYEFNDLDAMQYTITVQKTGYRPNRKLVTLLQGDPAEANIPLTKFGQ